MAKEPELKANHVETAIANLQPDFRLEQCAPNLHKLVRVLVGEVQELEELWWALIFDRTLDTASGYVLDQWGRVVGEPRDGLDDATYRNFIRARIASNNSDGTPETLIGIIKTITGANSVHYWNVSGPNFYMQIEVDAPLSAAEIQKVISCLNEAIPSGVGFVLIESQPNPWTYNTGPGYNVGPYSRVIS